MYNIVGAIIFIAFSFAACMSISFKVISLFIDEDKAFSSFNGAILIYFISVVCSVIMTILLYMIVCKIQVLKELLLL